MKAKFKLGDVVRLTRNPHSDWHPSQNPEKHVGELFVIKEVKASYDTCVTATQEAQSFSYSVIPLQDCTMVAWFDEWCFELVLDLAAHLGIPGKEFKLQRDVIEERRQG